MSDACEPLGALGHTPTTPDKIVEAIYAAISGRRDQERDWSAVRAFMLPGARIRPIRPDHDGQWTVGDLSVDEWFALAARRFQREDFFERGVSFVHECTGRLAFLASAYESRHDPKALPFERGVNHYTFVQEGLRWQIAQIAWEVESPRHPLSTAASEALRNGIG